MPIANELEMYNNVKGSALFFRSQMFYHLVQVFAPPYDANTAMQDPGIALKLRGDINERVTRASVQETYDKILSDLKEASAMLPSSASVKTRPTKPAAFALLARTYLTMHRYEDAYRYADSCLKLFNTLMDFNDSGQVDLISSPGIRNEYNSEMILFTKMINNPTEFFMNNQHVLRVDSNLYSSYHADDLRRLVFFMDAWDSGKVFKGSYDRGYRTLFAGIAADEIFLIRAECSARLGNISGAMADLNALMFKRWKTGSFVPFSASTANEALNLVLTERRKELVFRSLRWTDLRRLNKEGANITLTRVLNGQTYTLPPNDKRYTFLIPHDVMSFNPSWQQNPR